MSDARLLIALARAKQRFPAMRMAQIICNAVSAPDTHAGNDPFYVTDEALIKALDSYCAAFQPTPHRRRSTDK